jgi:hypothetical protein
MITKSQANDAQRIALENELKNLCSAASVSDQPENAAKRTPEELAERYRWSDRMYAIRRELQQMRDAAYEKAN